MDIKRAQRAMEQVAQRNGVSLEQVQAEIEQAIAEAMARTENDPETKKLWDKIPRTDGRVTPQDLIAYVGNQIEKNYKISEDLL